MRSFLCLETGPRHTQGFSSDNSNDEAMVMAIRVANRCFQACANVADVYPAEGCMPGLTDAEVNAAFATWKEA
jgi:hypothetical protein